jgi:RimJ/RimL family protein N-acetyltransferase
MQLSPEVLMRRSALPLKPDTPVLTGSKVLLRPLDAAAHAEALFRVSNGQPVTIGNNSSGPYDADERIWRYMSAGPFSGIGEFRAYLDRLQAPPNQSAYCAVLAAGGEPCGVTTLMNNVPEHLKIELGNIWYSPAVQGTGVNAEAAFLMLEHCFNLGYRRVEWKCDALNERSRRAALRIGFQFEGIQQAHMIIKGRNRDTAWFRILDSEWPAVALRGLA